MLKICDVKSQLRPGRHVCHCQAKIHKLVRNCLNCGRIVCEQEGSGPCFNCFSLVCTREEREILGLNNKKSYELLSRLSSSMLNGVADPLANFNSLKKKLLEGESASMLKANEFKSRLLDADKNGARTKVNDLETDYYSLENNSFLSPTDRELIIKRKEELRIMALEAKRKIIFDLDISNKKVSETKQDSIETVNDPEIRSILLNSLISKSTKTCTDDDDDDESENNVLSNDFVKNYTPKYINENYSNLKKAEINKTFKGKHLQSWCLLLPQPLASLLVAGNRRHIPCHKEIKVRGAILIASLKKNQTSTLLNEDCKDLISNDCTFSSILGRAILVDCLTWEEYNTEFLNGECSKIANGFVLIFKFQESLVSPVPHTLLNNFSVIDRDLEEVVKRNLMCDSALNINFNVLQ